MAVKKPQQKGEKIQEKEERKMFSLKTSFLNKEEKPTNVKVLLFFSLFPFFFHFRLPVQNTTRKNKNKIIFGFNEFNARRRRENEDFVFDTNMQTKQKRKFIT